MTTEQAIEILRAFHENKPLLLCNERWAPLELGQLLRQFAGGCDIRIAPPVHSPEHVSESALPEGHRFLDADEIVSGAPEMEGIRAKCRDGGWHSFPAFGDELHITYCTSLSRSELAANRAEATKAAEPKPKEMVPLEGRDYAPGDLVRWKGCRVECQWRHRTPEGLLISDHFLQWQELADRLEISRDNGATWQECRKEKP